jgi:YD repeat-containing protein
MVHVSTARGGTTLQFGLLVLMRPVAPSDVLTGRLSGTRDTDHASNELDYALMGYDAAGNPTLKVTLDGRHTMTYDNADQLLSEHHPIAGVKTWTFDPAGNRLSQDFTQVNIRTVTLWTYGPSDQIINETTGAAISTFTFDGAGNQQIVAAPGQTTTNVWDQENRLRQIIFPDGTRNTMSYRADGLRAHLVDADGDHPMVWDSQGSSGYQDLLEEADQ